MSINKKRRRSNIKILEIQHATNKNLSYKIKVDTDYIGDEDDYELNYNDLVELAEKLGVTVVKIEEEAELKDIITLYRGIAGVTLGAKLVGRLSLKELEDYVLSKYKLERYVPVMLDYSVGDYIDQLNTALIQLTSFVGMVQVKSGMRLSHFITKPDFSFEAGKYETAIDFRIGNQKWFKKRLNYLSKQTVRETWDDLSPLFFADFFTHAMLGNMTQLCWDLKRGHNFQKYIAHGGEVTSAFANIIGIEFKLGSGGGQSSISNVDMAVQIGGNKLPMHLKKDLYAQLAQYKIFLSKF